MMTVIFLTKFTKDGRILLEHNGVLLNFDNSIVTDNPEFITGDEWFKLFGKSTPDKKDWTKEMTAQNRANDKHTHYGR